MPSTPAIRVQGLSKTYVSSFGNKAIHALQALDLRIVPGEIFGLLGPNGAGKTTLLKVLLGIVRPTEGEAALFGTSILKPAARQRIGYLPENHRFQDFLTAAQMLDLYGRMAAVPEALRKQRIPELLDLVRMSEWRDTKIRKFSKGMMQRLGLAQALLNDPDLVFLDEPTDGVDPLGRREIRDLLLWMRGEGKTIFLNSHLLSEVEQVCTRVAILDKGKLVREGTVSALTAVDRAYEVRCTPIPEALLSTLNDRIQLLNDATLKTHADLAHYRLTSPDRADLNALLDQLRAEDVQLESVHPVQLSLEDYFIEVVS